MYSKIGTSYFNSILKDNIKFIILDKFLINANLRIRMF